MSETQPETPAADADLEGQQPTVPAQASQPYVESEDHRPDITAMSGTLETSGTGGGRHAHLAGVSRIFGNVESFMGQVEDAAKRAVDGLVGEVRTIVSREEAASKVQPVTQQTTQEGGTAVHEGDIVQGDGTGVPAPTTPAEQTQTVTPDTSTGTADQSAPVAQQQTLTGDAKTDGDWPEEEYTGDEAPVAPPNRPARKTAAKKTASGGNGKK